MRENKNGKPPTKAKREKLWQEASEMVSAFYQKAKGREAKSVSFTDGKGRKTSFRVKHRAGDDALLSKLYDSEINYGQKGLRSPAIRRHSKNDLMKLSSMLKGISIFHQNGDKLDSKERGYVLSQLLEDNAIRDYVKRLHKGESGKNHQDFLQMVSEYIESIPDPDDPDEEIKMYLTPVQKKEKPVKYGPEPSPFWVPTRTRPRKARTTTSRKPTQKGIRDALKGYVFTDVADGSPMTKSEALSRDRLRMLTNSLPNNYSLQDLITELQQLGVVASLGGKLPNMEEYGPVPDLPPPPSSRRIARAVRPRRTPVTTNIRSIIIPDAPPTALKPLTRQQWRELQQQQQMGNSWFRY